MSILEMEHLSHAFGDVILYQDASLRLNAGEHMGLIGDNGAGKSTLLKIIMGTFLPDAGSLWIAPRCRLGYLDQQAKLNPQETIREYLKSAHERLYQVERQMEEKYQQAAENQDQGALLQQAARLQETLEREGFYEIEYQMERIARGLGVYAMGYDTPMAQLSGGQRAKVILTKLLLESPDVLLMDEPTNFLDAEQIQWLIQFLQNYPGAFIVVSHNQEFLEPISQCISDLAFGKITTYRGSFLAAMRQKEFNRQQKLRLYESQQKQIQKLETYIARNKVRASTAAMAKSREKALAKMERIAPPASTGAPQFRFPAIRMAPQVVLEVKNLQIGYETPLLPPLTFKMKSEESVAICGFNGVGKTTLLNTLMGRLPKLDGFFYLCRAGSIAYFEQETKWERQVTPLSYLRRLFPDRREGELRGALARAAVKREHMRQEMVTLSGGEQAKVKLASMSLAPHSFLILDEPTNHLDEKAKEALIEALRSYHGALIVVSHEKAFCQAVAQRIIMLGS